MPTPAGACTGSTEESSPPSAPPRLAATGKVKSAAAGKRHGMIKRSNKFIRDARGMMVLAEPDARKVVKNFLPNGGGL